MTAMFILYRQCGLRSSFSTAAHDEIALLNSLKSYDAFCRGVKALNLAAFLKGVS